MLAKEILELRSLAVAMAGSKPLPLQVRNFDPFRFQPGYESREPKVPLFLEPRPPTTTTEEILFGNSFPGTTSRAIDKAKDLLRRYFISESELKGAIRDVVQAEIANINSSKLNANSRN